MEVPAYEGDGVYSVHVCESSESDLRASRYGLSTEEPEEEA